MSISAVESPPEAFNFAAHLLRANAGRPGKTAFIDDAGTVTYGELDDRVRRFAASLKARGVRREERVLILMQDGADWPVAFLGAMLAGAVPVGVNTLLTADDLAYMLEHSRAQAVFVSGAVKPALKAALTKSDHEVHTVVVSRPAQPLDFGDIAFEDFLAGAAPLVKPARTHADDPAFWLYSSGSTGRPKGTVHSHANPYWTTELYGKAILGLQESDVCFSAAKLFFAYGLGNALTFPLAVGATALLMAERPTPGRRIHALAGRRRRGEADRLLWRADRLRRHARFSSPAGGEGRQRCGLSRPPAKRCRRRSASASSATSASTSSTASARPRCCTSSSPTAPTRCATARPAGRCRATPSNCGPRTGGGRRTASRAISTFRDRRRR